MRFTASTFTLSLILFSLPAFGQVEKIFQEVDGDKDGLVTRAELEKAGRRSGWITLADKDGDSAVSVAEAKAYFGAIGESDTDTESTITVGEISDNSKISETSCRASAEYSAEQNGYSFLVMEKGEIVFERYDQGRTPETAHRLASGTKSFSGAMIAVAVKDGLLALDEPVSETIDEWKVDKKLAVITVRQLLSLTSGIPGGSVGKVSSYQEAIDTKVVSRPGDTFSYGPVPFQVFGELMRRKLAKREEFGFSDPLAYLDDRIFAPIGLSYANWRRDENAMPHLPSGAFLTAREWAKFGHLLLQNGKWEGEPLLDAATLVECLEGTEANPKYGVTFWLIDPDGEPKLEGAYMAAGAGKQRLYVLPAVELVVVRQGESRKFDDRVLLNKLLVARPTIQD